MRGSSRTGYGVLDDDVRARAELPLPGLLQASDEILQSPFNLLTWWVSIIGEFGGRLSAKTLTADESRLYIKIRAKMHRNMGVIRELLGGESHDTERKNRKAAKVAAAAAAAAPMDEDEGEATATTAKRKQRSSTYRSREYLLSENQRLKEKLIADFKLAHADKLFLAARADQAEAAVGQLRVKVENMSKTVDSFVTNTKNALSGMASPSFDLSGILDALDSELKCVRNADEPFEAKKFPSLKTLVEQGLAAAAAAQSSANQADFSERVRELFESVHTSAEYCNSDEIRSVKDELAGALSRLDGEVEKRAAAEQAAANSSTLFHAAKLEFVALNAKIGKCAMRDVSRAEERSYVEELLALVNQALDIASPFRAERQQLFTSSRGGPPSAVVAAERKRVAGNVKAIEAYRDFLVIQRRFLELPAAQALRAKSRRVAEKAAESEGRELSDEGPINMVSPRVQKAVMEKRIRTVTKQLESIVEQQKRVDKQIREEERERSDFNKKQGQSGGGRR